MTSSRSETLTLRAAGAGLTLLLLAGCGAQDPAPPETTAAAGTTASDAEGDPTPTPSPDQTTEPSPEPSPEASPEPTPQPEVIAYAGGESAGYFVQSRADAQGMTRAPADFRAFIGRAAAELDGAACPDAATGITVEFVSTAGWATGGVNECGGYAAIWGRVDGAWAEVDATQDSFDCGVLHTYRIPSDVVGDTCYDYEANKGHTYHQA